MSDSTYDLSKVIDAIDSGPSLNGVNASTVTVGPSTSNLVLFNTARVFTIIFNLTGTLFIKLGTSASLVSYSFQLGPAQMVSIDRWNGVISAVGNGTTEVRVTEVF